jgi:hypothetical protein
VWSQRHKGAQSNHKASTQTRPLPSHFQPNHLIKRGFQTACNRKLDYHDSCILCKGSALYQWVLISSLAEQLETSFFHSCTSFGVWPIDHYMLLQRSTTGVRHALLRFLNQRSLLAVVRVPAETSPLASCGLGRSQSLSQSISKSMMSFPLNRAQHTSYSIPNQ